MSSDNHISIIQAMKISIEVEKEKLIYSIMNNKSCNRNEALKIIENGKNNENKDFYNWWNCWCLHGYLDALNDVLDAIQ